MPTYFIRNDGSRPELISLEDQTLVLLACGEELVVTSEYAPEWVSPIRLSEDDLLMIEVTQRETRMIYPVRFRNVEPENKVVFWIEEGF